MRSINFEPLPKDVADPRMRIIYGRMRARSLYQTIERVRLLTRHYHRVMGLRRNPSYWSAR